MSRIVYLDIAKAICMILVVIGHYSPMTAPEYWQQLIRVIYTFHMPLFMFTSGLIYILSKNTPPPDVIKDLLSRKRTGLRFLISLFRLY